LDQDYFKFQDYTGVNIHGILGADFFRRFVVQINYRKRKIKLIDPARFKRPGKKFKEVDLQISRNKPYINTITETSPDTTANLRLLLDTGASLPLMLFTSTHPDLNVPDNVIRSTIGMGLGGSIEGYLGRVHEFDLGGFKFGEVITNFQDVIPQMDTVLMRRRNGLVGNVILSRFTIYIDYIKNKLYLNPNKEFSRQFKYDLSGITLIAGGKNFNEFSVLRVLKGSAADDAGIQAGDKILRVNNLSSTLLSFPGILSKLRKKPGKTVRLVVLREGERLKYSFKLREII